MATTPYPLAISEDLLDEVKAAASETGLSNADVMRQSIKLGLPRLRKKLSVKPGLIAFTKAERRAAFARDTEWERLEAVMARRPISPPEAD